MSPKKQRKPKVEPVWVAGQKAAQRARSRHDRRAATRPWRVHYDLAYDDGGDEFDEFYRTYFGARWSAFWHLHVWSWGGSAKLYPNAPSRPL
jgi:hypothetical protein